MSKYKYSLSDVKKNMISIQTKLEKKDIAKYLLEINPTKYANKHFAKINIWFNDKLLTDLENFNISESKNTDVLAITIMIYLTNSDGKFTTNSSNIWSIKLIYSLEDLLKSKFSMEDIELVDYTSHEAIAAPMAV